MRKTKTKKALSILCTLALVFGLFAAFPAQEAEAGTTYSSLTSPTVPDNDDQRLGVAGIEIDPLVDNIHEAWVEVEDGWDINFVTVTKLVYNDTEATGLTGRVRIDNDPVDVGLGAFVPGENERVNSVEIDDDNFTLWLDTTGWDEVEIWLEFTSVDVDDTGPIRAYFTNLQGQLLDGNVLIGRGAAGELHLSVREYDHFSDEGDVIIRIIEDTRGTFDDGDVLRLRLPRGFEWNEGATYNIDQVFGDAWLVDDEISDDGRDLRLWFDSDSSVRSAIDLRTTGFAIQVADPARAQKGDVMAEVLGDYDTVPDELRVGVYGDFEYTVTPRDAEIVYAGRVEQDIADITFAEDITGTFVAGRSVTMKLPEWAKWGALERTRAHNDVRLTLSQFYAREGREAVYRVSGGSDEDPAAIRLRDMEIILSPEAPVGEDVVVEIAGSAGVRGEVVVGVVAAPATLEVDPINIIGIGRANQEVGTITITEAEAEMFKDGKDIILRLDRDTAWEPGYTVEVVEGDIDLGAVRRFADDRELRIRVEAESDEASTIQVTAAVRTLRTIPEGDAFVRLRGDAIVEVTDWEALESQYGEANIGDIWILIHDEQLVRVDNIFPDQEDAAVAVLADVGVPAPPVEEPEPVRVVMWIGQTTFTVNGEAGTMDVPPFIENGRTFVPVRFVAESFGAEADWEPKNGAVETVTLTKDDMVITITIGSPVITILENDTVTTVTADVAAQIVEGRTMLPLRAVGEIFGAEFDWGPKVGGTEWVSFTM